jgi:hypothetical protein
VHEGIPGLIPYLDSLGLTASLFAGAYVASERRLKLVAILPLLIVIAEGIASEGVREFYAPGSCLPLGFSSAVMGWQKDAFAQDLDGLVLSWASSSW